MKLDSFNEIVSMLIRKESFLGKELYDLNIEDVLELSSALQNSVPTISEFSDSSFDFSANSSLSGYGHPCAEPECRLEKVNHLAKFAALYADKTYIRNPFEDISLKTPDEIRKHDYMDLAIGIMVTKFLSPLIEEGLISFSSGWVHLCQDHRKEILDKAYGYLNLLCEELYETLEETYLKSCVIEFDYTKTGYPFIKITGPEHLVEHGVIYHHILKNIPSNLAKYSREQTPVVLDRAFVKEEGILALAIKPVLEDIRYQEWQSKFYGLKFLTDQESQMAAIQCNGINFEAESALRLNAGLSHVVPTLELKNIEYILRLREKEHDSFKVYRDSIFELIREFRPENIEETIKLFDENIRPQLNKLEKRINIWKKNLRESVKEKVVLGAGVVTLGLYSGILPPELGKVVAAVGGLSSIVDALNDINRSLKESFEARNSDLYFLWKLKK